MIYRILVGFFCLLAISTEAQVLRELNYNHLYNPSLDFSFSWRVARLPTGFKVFYELRLNEGAVNRDLSMTFETRGSLGEKSGNSITVPPPEKLQNTSYGIVDFSPSPEQTIIVAKITISNPEKPKVFVFQKQLPVNITDLLLSLGTNHRVILNPFVNSEQPVIFSDFETKNALQISYYKVSFPAAAPAFSNTLAKVSKTMKPDSVFAVGSNASVEFDKKGLYLAQQDTLSAGGIAFRVEEDYPKINTIESLAGPLIYICTKQEAEKLKQVGNDKKKFDQLILSITGNADRAKTFMRNYYKRVELANQYFSSYKEGWKTDRGMIYIIFGLPDEVYLFEDREVWEYKSTNTKARFQFTKSPSLFDPDNYVLIRDKKFTTPWYETIDLWRKARL